MQKIKLNLEKRLISPFTTSLYHDCGKDRLVHERQPNDSDLRFRVKLEQKEKKGVGGSSHNLGFGLVSLCCFIRVGPLHNWGCQILKAILPFSCFFLSPFTMTLQEFLLEKKESFAKCHSTEECGESQVCKS